MAQATLVAALAATACGSEPAGGGEAQPACLPGQTRTCACREGVRGLQTCSDDLARWTGCSCPASAEGEGEGEGDGEGEGGEPAPHPAPPLGAVPCDHMAAWPESVASATLPLWVHYQRSREEETAREVLGYLERSWRVEVDELGFRQPLSDAGTCGPDGGFDVFLWRGAEESYVDVLEEDPDTPWDDWSAYMVVDPWGEYGGEILEATLAHELNHACQAADDWWEVVLIYEATATFVEDAVFDDVDDYLWTLEDFQARPHRSLDWDDGLETWFMYGASLYLFFLRDYYFEGDASFAGRMWLEGRSPGGGADDDDALNEPDFQDALDGILADRAGVSFVDSILAFARWRWYTGERDDGRHFEEGALFPDEAEVAVAARVRVPMAETRLAIRPTLMLLGTVYVDLIREPEDPLALTVAVEGGHEEEVRWVVQALPGADGRDGDQLDLTSGPARLELTGDTTLAFTAVPAGPYDPDTRDDARFSLTVVLGPAEGE